VQSITASLRARRPGQCFAGVKSSIVPCSLNPPASLGFSLHVDGDDDDEDQAPVGGLYIIRHSIAVDLAAVVSPWRLVTPAARAQTRNQALFHASPAPLPSLLSRSLIKRPPTPSDGPHGARGNNTRFNLHVLVADSEAASVGYKD